MQRSTIRCLAQSSLLAALTAILAWIILPLPIGPVPISGQSFGVMLAGLLLPPRWAAASQAIYLGLGLIGLPVFAGGGAGLGILVGPTGGYLVGFLLGAPVTAWMSAELSSYRTIGAAVAVLVGCVALVHFLGVLQLAAVAGLSLQGAFIVGTLPFLPGDILKSLVAVAVYSRLAQSGLIELHRKEFERSR